MGVGQGGEAPLRGTSSALCAVWGYEDEKDPAVMAKKIRAAATHGVDAFIFDWYWYEGGPFLNRCLDEGFLGAPNTDSLKFALMWGLPRLERPFPGHCRT